jgi:hypothetical protein
LKFSRACYFVTPDLTIEKTNLPSRKIHIHTKLE